MNVSYEKKKIISMQIILLKLCIQLLIDRQKSFDTSNKLQIRILRLYSVAGYLKNIVLLWKKIYI